MQTIPGTQTPAQLPTTGTLQRLTVQDAEALALKNNPQISVYHLLALASHQVTREQKAAYYPDVYGSLTAVEPKEGSRIAAGNLNNPIVYERAAGGLTLSQLITDFGRTNNLVATAALRAKAADMNALATADQIKLAVDQAFYNALQTVALLKVAEQTVAARQLVSDQITTLFQNKLRSQLDVSFANANLAQAKLLLLDAQNNYQAALSALSQILGYASQQQFELVDSAAQLKPPPDAVSQLVDQAFSNRPEIAAQSYEYQAAQHFQKAERDLLFPSVDALGRGGPHSLQQHHRRRLALHQLVRRGGSERQHSNLQRLPLSCAFEGGSAARAGRRGAAARLERPDRQRCSYQLAERHHRLQPDWRDPAVCGSDQPCG